MADRRDMDELGEYADGHTDTERYTGENVLCRFLDPLVYLVMGYPRCRTVKAAVFSKEAVVALDEVVFEELYATGFLKSEEYRVVWERSILNAYLHMRPKLKNPRYRDLVDVFRIWFSAASASSDCELALTGESGYEVALEIPGSLIQSGTHIEVTADEVGEWKRRLGVDSMLSAWHAGVPLGYVTGRG